MRHGWHRWHGHFIRGWFPRFYGAARLPFKLGEFLRFYGLSTSSWHSHFIPENSLDSMGYLPAPRNRSITKPRFKDSFTAHYFKIDTMFSKQRHGRFMRGEFLSFDRVTQAAVPPVSLRDTKIVVILWNFL